MVVPPPKPRRKRSKPVPQQSGPPPVDLYLLIATYDPDGPIATLTFDRPIDVSGLNGAAFVVDDGPDGEHMVGSGASHMLDANTVQVYFVYNAPFEGGDTLLTVSADSGIVAVDDGGTFGGITALTLPYNAG